MILHGKPVADAVLDGVRAGVAALRARTGTAPTLAVVLVGDFAPSQVYVANKKRAASSLESKFGFDLTLPMLVLRNEVLEP